MIEARNLVKCYGSTVAVNDLSFSIGPGERDAALRASAA
jgi:ABC-type multidrug transport system ATPase subunit